jgi:AcrR family transcriptional regulator
VRLVRAATDVFAEEGYEGARVQDIAARAGYTTGAIYAHFNGKTGLLASVLAEYGGSFVASVAGRIDSQPHTRDVVLALATFTQSGTPAQYQRIIADSFAVAARDSDVRGALLPLLEQARSVLGDLVERAQEREVIDADISQDALVHLAMTLLLGSIFVRAIQLGEPGSVDARDVMDRFLSGFAPLADQAESSRTASSRLSTRSLRSSDETWLRTVTGAT